MEFKNLKIAENEKYKICKSSDYNFIFNKENGFFARWGKTKEEDPIYAPSPEILDIEISTGKCSGMCKFCYKDNGEDKNTHHMTFEEFKTIFHKIPNLTQIAFGICDVDSNPDFFKMMEYARKNGVIPNYTCNGLKVTDEVADKTAKLCGAVAVSIVNKEKSFKTIRKFLQRGMKQVNIHYVLSSETYDKAFEIVEEIASDETLKDFNAIVFLQYKAKGKNKDSFHSLLDVEKYKKLMKHYENNNINYGFDSCSAPIFLNSIKGEKNEEKLAMMADPCEGGICSSYINCYGKFYVCSFAEGEDTWEEGIDVLNCNNFIKDVWFNPRLIKWRKRLLDNKRNCPIYNLSTVKV